MAIPPLPALGPSRWMTALVRIDPHGEGVVSDPHPDRVRDADVAADIRLDETVIVAVTVLVAVHPGRRRVGGVDDTASGPSTR